MTPWTHHQKIMIGLPFVLQRKVTVNGAPHVLLVPQSLYPHGRDVRRLLCDEFVERLSLPECVVGWMVEQLLRPRKILQPVLVRIVSRGNGAAECFVVVVSAALNCFPFPGFCRLARSVIEVRLAKSPVVKPIVTHPSIDHRAFGSGYFEGGVGSKQSHHDSEPFI